ncbi:MAG TPA: GNAT family protein [Acidimicrobiales bacterium]|nr:GNAT family protein [Acidimicrobiales bacterium]
MEEHRSADLEQAWPLLGLSAVHRDLLLREATDDDIVALARVVEEGLVEPGNEHFVPRLLLGRAATFEERLANFLRYHWGRRAATTPEKWHLAFAIVVDGEVVGSQAVHTTNFAVLREVHTGSYLSRRAQGRGVGTRMRTIVLDLAFGHFGAQWATSGFVEGNERSRRISERLGYQADGNELLAISARAVESQRLRLSRKRWLEHRPPWLEEVSFAGVERAAAFLGIEPQPTTSRGV